MGTPYSPLQKFTITQNMILYAEWEQNNNKLTIEVIGDGHVTSSNDAQIDCNKDSTCTYSYAQDKT